MRRFIPFSILFFVLFSLTAQAKIPSVCQHVLSTKGRAHASEKLEKKARARDERQFRKLQDTRQAQRFGPQFQMRKLETVRELTVMSYNVLNLKMKVGRFERLGATFERLTNPSSKSDAQIRGVTDAFVKNNPDIAILQEIEGIESLGNYINQELGGRYHGFILRGNDERGIEVGILLKKDLPLETEYETHRDLKWKDPVTGDVLPLFSRDIPALIIRRPNDSDAKPLIIVLGNHSKSKRDRKTDPLSTRWRTAQMEGLATILKSYYAKYGNDVNIIAAGDFNTDVRTAKEMDPVRGLLKDSFDIAGLSGDKRVTHTYHPRDAAMEASQIDAIFLSPNLASAVLMAKVHRYTDATGREKPLPKTYKEREQNPSDHFPVVVRLKTSRIFPEAYAQPAQR